MPTIPIEQARRELLLLRLTSISEQPVSVHCRDQASYEAGDESRRARYLAVMESLILYGTPEEQTLASHFVLAVNPPDSYVDQIAEDYRKGRRAVGDELSLLFSRSHPRLGVVPDSEQAKRAKLQEVARRAEPLLAGLAELTDATALLRIWLRLRPQPDDYLEVFCPDLAMVAKKSYNRFWETLSRQAEGTQGPEDLPKTNPAQNHVIVTAAFAHDLQQDNPYSRGFPGGYRKIADRLSPGQVWLSWKFVEPGQASGMSYDGLVWMDRRRFAWFPKPWRLLRENKG